LKMPKKLLPFEAEARSVIREYVSRGKVDVFISMELEGGDGTAVSCNTALAQEYLKHLHELSESFGLKDEISLLGLARLPEVFNVEDSLVDEDSLRPILDTALRAACESFTESRKREGENLVATILSKVDSLEAIREEIVVRSPEVVELYRQKITARINDLLTSEQREFYDDNRLAAEVAVFADKCAIDEEMARLASHFSQARKILAEEETVGKKMDFLVQEINREVNTTGSKANDIEITSRVLLMKNLVEEIREQIQNLV